MVSLSCDEVADGLVVGSYPQSPEDVAHLAAVLSVTAVLNLQDDEDMELLGLRWDALQRAYTANGILALREPVRDMSPRALLLQLPRCVAALRQLRNAGRRVYLHCTYGLNRSATVAIAYLHAHEGLSVADAAAQVTTRHRCCPYDEVVRRIDEVL